MAKPIRAILVAAILLTSLVVGHPVASRNQPLDLEYAFKTPDVSLSAVFSAKTVYECNCSMSGKGKKLRRIVAYVRADASNQWNPVASCEDVQGYPGFVLDVGASRSMPVSVLLTSWVKMSNGDWVQESFQQSFQSDDQLNRRFWQWQFGPARKQRNVFGDLGWISTADVRFYRQRGYIISMERDPVRKPAKRPWKAAYGDRSRWGIVTIASGYYTNYRALNQPWNTRSAERMVEAIEGYGPTYVARITASEDQPLAADRLTKSVVDAISAAKKRRIDFLVFYYVGHGAAVRGDDVWLLMGDLDLSDLKRFDPEQSVSDELDSPAPPYNSSGWNLTLGARV